MRTIKVNAKKKGTVTHAIKALLHSLGRTPSQVAKKLRRLGFKGTTGNANSCPIHNFLASKFPDPWCISVDVDIEVSSPDHTLFQHEVRVSEVINKFIRNFDNGLYPELEKR